MCFEKEARTLTVSKIRKKEFRPAPAPAAAAVSRSGYPPRILKRAGLESSGTNSGKSALVVWKNLP